MPVDEQNKKYRLYLMMYYLQKFRHVFVIKSYANTGRQMIQIGSMQITQEELDELFEQTFCVRFKLENDNAIVYEATNNTDRRFYQYREWYQKQELYRRFLFYSGLSDLFGIGVFKA